MDSMDMIAVNELLQFENNNGEPTIKRVLWLDEENIIMFTIDVFSKDALPQLHYVSDILTGLRAETIQKVEKDPYFRVLEETSLASRSKELRDTAWKVLAPLVEPKNEPYIYYKDLRGKLIAELVSSNRSNKRVLYKYLRRYWQRGKNINTLLPDYHHCGNKDIIKGISTKKEDGLEKI